MRKATYLMGILDDADIEWMARNGAVRQVAAGEVLIKEGQPIGSLEILLEGRLTVESGGSQLAEIRAGEIVGEISFIDDRAPSATVIACEPCRVLELPRERLRARIFSDPRFAANFYRAVAVFLADRLRDTTSLLGYGSGSQDDTADDDEVSEVLMASLSVARVRFERLLKRLQGV